MNRYLVRGLVLWVVGTVLLRIVPAAWIPAERVSFAAGSTSAIVVLLYAASFTLLLLFLGRPLVRALPPAEAGGALIGLALPTLVLDAFSSAFFARVFPNLPANAAGIFGGWMLVCCAGCLAAAFLFRPAALR